MYQYIWLSTFTYKDSKWIKTKGNNIFLNNYAL